jgi:hypothetical protein
MVNLYVKNLSQETRKSTACFVPIEFIRQTRAPVHGICFTAATEAPCPEHQQTEI